MPLTVPALSATRQVGDEPRKTPPLRLPFFNPWPDERVTKVETVGVGWLSNDLEAVFGPSIIFDEAT